MCSGILTNATGWFSSPVTKLGVYPDNTECKWTIAVPPNGNITIKFVKFYTEEW